MHFLIVDETTEAKRRKQKREKQSDDPSEVIRREGREICSQHTFPARFSLRSDGIKCVSLSKLTEKYPQTGYYDALYGISEWIAFDSDFVLSRVIVSRRKIEINFSDMSFATFLPPARNLKEIRIKRYFRVCKKAETKRNLNTFKYSKYISILIAFI